jgi:hypothetical protein
MNKKETVCEQVDWLHLVEKMVPWWALVKESSGFIKATEFLDKPSNYNLLKQNLLHGLSTTEP